MLQNDRIQILQFLPKIEISVINGVAHSLYAMIMITDGGVRRNMENEYDFRTNTIQKFTMPKR